MTTARIFKMFITLNKNVRDTESYFNQLNTWLIQVYLRLMGHLKALNAQILRLRTDQPINVKDERH